MIHVQDEERRESTDVVMAKLRWMPPHQSQVIRPILPAIPQPCGATCPLPLIFQRDLVYLYNVLFLPFGPF